MDCRNLEQVLWENPSKYSDKDRLTPEMASHIDSCEKCRGAYLRFLNLMGLSGKSELVKSEDYWEKFEDNVWGKIESIQNSPDFETGSATNGTLGVRHSSIAFKHLAASIGVAAAAVFLMLTAVSDITSRTEAPLPVMAKKGAAPSFRSHPTQNIQPGLNIVLNRAPEGGLQIQDFSILPQPEVTIVSDSALVTIESAFLTDEGLKDKNIDVTRALSKDVVMKTGRIDSSVEKMRASREVAQTNWIISVEKMPRMIKAVPPEYPYNAFNLKRGGDVWVKAKISAGGDVEEAIIYRDSGTNFGFEEAALEAAYKNKFEPFNANGENLPIWVIYQVRFVTKR